MPKEPNEIHSEFMRLFLGDYSVEKHGEVYTHTFTPESTRIPTEEEARMAEERLEDLAAQAAEWSTD